MFSGIFIVFNYIFFWFAIFLIIFFQGCWCLPNGASDLGVGTGPPIDDIDRSCREFATCYNCLYNQEIGAGCDEAGKGRYTIKGRQDGATGQKYLMCSKYFKNSKINHPYFL